jgi:hypothetical protein
VYGAVWAGCALGGAPGAGAGAAFEAGEVPLLDELLEGPLPGVVAACGFAVGGAAFGACPVEVGHAQSFAVESVGVKAVCLVGGCRVVLAEGESVVELELRVEEHRRLFHDWVKPGRCHRLEEDEAPVVVVVPAAGRARRRGHRDAA